MPRELSKSYNPGEIEAPLYKEWCEKGYFTPSPDKNKQHFTIVIPPPNVTGQLHMGHALDESMQDTIIRYKRMQGFCTLWVPGTDHAGIATQIKVEEMLRKEQGLSRYDLGREKFIDSGCARMRPLCRCVQPLRRREPSRIGDRYCLCGSLCKSDRRYKAKRTPF